MSVYRSQRCLARAPGERFGWRLWLYLDPDWRAVVMLALFGAALTYPVACVTIK